MTMKKLTELLADCGMLINADLGQITEDFLIVPKSQSKENFMQHSY